MNPKQAEKLIRWASSASLLVATSLIVLKLVAWIMTGSVSLFASLVDSLLDAAASLINFIVIRYALKPADDDHRFGHGKAESLAGLAQAVFILSSAIFLLLQITDRFLNPLAIKDIDTGTGVMAISLIMTITLVIFQRHVVAKTKSLAIKADSLHYTTDIIANIAVIIALLLSGKWPIADAIFALFAALFIAHSSWSITKEALDVLMDKELPEDELQKIYSIIKEEKSIQGFHDLRTRQSGRSIFIQVHIVLSPEITLEKAHIIGDNIESNITKVFPNSECLIHLDPEDDHADNHKKHLN